ncbi:MAG: hypothetical protein EOL97_14660 [Spirochaetia bacterium]|nr:hypothetical protein [Spirochaetia bacterium]
MTRISNTIENLILYLSNSDIVLKSEIKKIFKTNNLTSFLLFLEEEGIVERCKYDDKIAYKLKR